MMSPLPSQLEMCVALSIRRSSCHHVIRIVAFGIENNQQDMAGVIGANHEKPSEITLSDDRFAMTDLLDLIRGDIVSGYVRHVTRVPGETAHIQHRFKRL